MRRTPARWLISVTLAVALAASCRTAPAPPPAPEPLPQLELEDLDRRALLLLLVDRQIFEGFAVERALEGAAGTRLELARALGRAAAPEGRVVLERLLADESQPVRHAAVFGLGELEQPLARGPLLEISAASDPVAARLAVESLAKLGADLATVEAALARLGPTERAARLLPSLYRFDPVRRREIASKSLDESDPRLAARAAYALCRDAVPEAAPVVRSLLLEADPWVRGWAARALGSIGEGSDLPRLRPLLDDIEPGPVIQALGAGAALVRRGAAAPPASWKQRLLELGSDRRAGVRITALEAMAAWLLDEDLAATLIARFEGGTPRERQVALLALAEGDDPRAADLVRRAIAGGDLQLRRRAARAAVELGLAELVDELLSDSHPAVRASVVEALLEGGLRPGAEVAERALADAAAAVRAVAARWLADHPMLPAETLLYALRPSSGEERTELEMHLIEALGLRGRRLDAERQMVADALGRLAMDEEYLVRRHAAEELSRLDLPAPPIGAAGESRPLSTYRDIVRRTARERWVRIETAHGDIDVRLACPDAPLTCLSFLQLAAQRFYDGLRFHRVVPDFVVQAGDPSGGGWGGPGYTLRDEINRLRFEAGTIGMAHAGPDTAGSQFFITLSPQPHLDGGYTAFGRVERGFELLRSIEQEDVILTIREIPPPGHRRELG